MPSVLIVDDEQHIRLLIEQTLEELEDDGIDLLTAAGRRGGRSASSTTTTRLVFLDVTMPRKSGIEVCQAIKSDPALSGTYVVLLTAKGQAHDREQGLAAGADLYMTKPFDPDDLLRRAREVLGLAGCRLMEPAEFKRLVVRHRHVAPMLSVLLAGTDARVVISDAEGAVILDRQSGAAPSDAPGGHPSHHGRRRDGRLGRGPRPAAAVASVLVYACSRELDKRALAREALDRYRELNLIYELADQIGATLEVDEVARVAVAEAGRLPTGGIGFLLLRDGGVFVARPDDDRIDTARRRSRATGILAAILAGDGEIVNDVAADPRSTEAERRVASHRRRSPAGPRRADRRHRHRVARTAGVPGLGSQGARRDRLARRPTLDQAAVHESAVRPAVDRRTRSGSVTPRPPIAIVHGSRRASRRAVLVYLVGGGPGAEPIAIVLAVLFPASLVLYGGAARLRASELRAQQALTDEAYQRSERANIDLQHRVAELMTLNELASAAGSTLDRTELLDRSLAAVTRHLRFDRALVLLADDDRGVLADGRSIGGSPTVTAEIEA